MGDDSETQALIAAARGAMAHAHAPYSRFAVGAAVSINHLIDMLESASTAQTGGASSHAILVKHLSKVANNQVRNVGSCECSNGRPGL